MREKGSWKRVVGAALGVAIGVAFALLCPDVGLSQQGVRCLAILMGAIVWWIAGVLPEYATGILMVVLFYVCAGVGVDVSMSAFASSTWWLLVAAFSLGASMKACGLMRRMALAILKNYEQEPSVRDLNVLAGLLYRPEASKKMQHEQQRNILQHQRQLLRIVL